MRSWPTGAGWKIVRYVAPLVLALLVVELFATSRAFTSATSDPATPTAAQHFTPDSSWSLVFDDEFNGTALDRSKWHTAYPWGRDRQSVGELQWYADDAFQEQDGILRIIAQRRTVEGHDYTSGMIASWDTFSTTYGYFEIRAKIPAGRALWPGFWLSPVSQKWPPEIDAFEALGQAPRVIAMTTHYTDPHNGQPAQDQGHYIGPDFSQGYHTFGVLWTPNQIVWYVDGVERFHSETQIPSEPMYLIANLAVGGPSAGTPDASTPFPSEFDVDYIRVYQRTGAPCGGTPVR